MGCHFVEWPMAIGHLHFHWVHFVLVPFALYCHSEGTNLYCGSKGTKKLYCCWVPFALTKGPTGNYPETHLSKVMVIIIMSCTITKIMVTITKIITISMIIVISMKLTILEIMIITIMI